MGTEWICAVCSGRIMSFVFYMASKLAESPTLSIDDTLKSLLAGNDRKVWQMKLPNGDTRIITLRAVYHEAAEELAALEELLLHTVPNTMHVKSLQELNNKVTAILTEIYASSNAASQAFELIEKVSSNSGRCVETGLRFDHEGIAICDRCEIRISLPDETTTISLSMFEVQAKLHDIVLLLSGQAHTVCAAETDLSKSTLKEIEGKLVNIWRVVLMRLVDLGATTQHGKS